MGEIAAVWKVIYTYPTGVTSTAEARKYVAAWTMDQAISAVMKDNPKAVLTEVTRECPLHIWNL